MRVHSVLPEALTAAVDAALEATAPVGLPLLAPVATWAGVTRTDEPCEGDPARHRGTVLRMIAHDTAIAARLVEDVRAAGQRAFVDAGGHEYGAPVPDCSLALPFAPDEDMTGTTAATLISEAVAGGARDRTTLLSALRIAGPFGEHGDPVDQPVWLCRTAEDWSLRPDRPL